MENFLNSQIQAQQLAICQGRSQKSDHQVKEREWGILDGQNEEDNQQINHKSGTVNTSNVKSEEKLQDKIKNNKSKQIKSVFHNFQKHLVITLRQTVKISKSKDKNQAQWLAWQIWQNFVQQTKIYTKNILHLVFGVVDYQNSDLTNIYNKDIINKFGYSQIFTHYSNPLITQAQSILRFQVVKQLGHIDIKDVIIKRRLANVDQFIKYVKDFIGQLQQGPMRKRLPKDHKIRMGLMKRMGQE